MCLGKLSHLSKLSEEMNERALPKRVCQARVEGKSGELGGESCDPSCLGRGEGGRD